MSPIPSNYSELLDKITADISQSDLKHRKQWGKKMGLIKAAEYEITSERPRDFYVSIIKKIEEIRNNYESQTSDQKSIILNKIKKLKVTIDNKLTQIEENESGVLLRSIRKKLKGVTPEIERQIKNMQLLSALVGEELQKMQPEEGNLSLIENALSFGLNTEHIKRDSEETQMRPDLGSSALSQENIKTQDQSSSSSSSNKEPDELNASVRNLEITLRKDHPEKTHDEIHLMIREALSELISSRFTEKSPAPTNSHQEKLTTPLLKEEIKTASPVSESPQIIEEQPVISGRASPPPPPPPPPSASGGKIPLPPPPPGGKQFSSSQPVSELTFEQKHLIGEEKRLLREKISRRSPETFGTRIPDRNAIEKARGRLQAFEEAYSLSPSEPVRLVIKIQKQKVDAAEAGALFYRSPKEEQFTNSLNQYTNQELQLILGLYFSHTSDSSSIKDPKNKEFIEECINFYNQEPKGENSEEFYAIKEGIENFRDEWIKLMKSAGAAETAFVDLTRKRLSKEISEPVHKPRDPVKRPDKGSEEQKTPNFKQKKSAASPLSIADEIKAGVILKKPQPVTGKEVDSSKGPRDDVLNQIKGGHNKLRPARRAEYSDEDIQKAFEKEYDAALIKKAEIICGSGKRRRDEKKAYFRDTLGSLDEKINDLNDTDIDYLERKRDLEEQKEAVIQQQRLYESALNFIQRRSPSDSLFVQDQENEAKETAWKNLDQQKKIPSDKLEDYRNRHR